MLTRASIPLIATGEMPDDDLELPPASALKLRDHVGESNETDELATLMHGLFG